MKAQNDYSSEAYKEFAEKLKDAAMSCLMGGNIIKYLQHDVLIIS